MSLSTYCLDYGRYVARLHRRRRRRARPREIPLATITWEHQFMGFLYISLYDMGMRLPLAALRTAGTPL